MWISVSVEIDKRPPPDRWGDYGYSHNNAVFEEGWFTYGIEIGNQDANEYFTSIVVWPRAKGVKEEPK